MLTKLSCTYGRLSLHPYNPSLREALFLGFLLLSPHIVCQNVAGCFLLFWFLLFVLWGSTTQLSNKSLTESYSCSCSSLLFLPDFSSSLFSLPASPALPCSCLTTDCSAQFLAPVAVVSRVSIFPGAMKGRRLR